MPALFYGKGAYRRDNGNLPELRLVNLFAEATPSDETGVILQSRRGLTSSATRGTGPIQGIFSQEGTFGGDIFTVSNGTLYRGATSLGAINGSGPVSWAASATEVVVTRGQSAYSYNGTNLAAITFPDSANVTAVEFIAGLFIYARADSHKFYWSATLDGRTIDALDFASAELRPDYLLDVKVMRGNLFLIGQETIEAWFPNGNADLPFSRIDQRLYPKGVAGTGCTDNLDNTLFLVGDDSIAYRLGDVPERISDHGIEERISASATVRTFSYSFEGHAFWCIRLDDGTFAYDAATGQWCEFASYGRDNFRAQCAANVDDTPYFGDDETNNVWVFGSTFQDNGSALEGYFTAALPLYGGTLNIDSVEVRANVGWTNPLSGDDATPVIEMRQSRDAGATFGSWREVSLGGQGNYRTRAQFRRCGLFDAPGAYFEFRVTDQSPRRISGVFYNEAGGGRSR